MDLRLYFINMKSNRLAQIKIQIKYETKNQMKYSNNIVHQQCQNKYIVHIAIPITQPPNNYINKLWLNQLHRVKIIYQIR